MFFDRFFSRISTRYGILWRSGAESTRLSPLRLRTEPLEDRSLLSINPGMNFAAASHSEDVVRHVAEFAPSGALSDAAPSISGIPLRANLQTVRGSANTATTVVATHFVVSMPPGATIGLPVTVQIVAEDAHNRVARGYSGTVDLTSSDAGATLPTDVIFTNGHASVQVTFATAAQQTVSVSDTADSSIAGTATTNVVAPDVVTHFVLYMPSGATAGTPVTVHVVAEDAQNDFVSTYTGTVDLTSSDGSATLPANVTFKHGHATFQVTFATDGLQSITATDSVNNSLTGNATTNVAAPAVATHFVLFMPQGAAVGTPITVSLAAEDAQNHFVSSYNGTANLTSSDIGATLPATVTFQNGHATFQVTFATGGQQTVTATDASLTGTATTNVAIPHFVVRLSPGVTIGTPVTVQLVAMDGQNHLLSTYSGTANLSTTDAGATLPASVAFQNGRASFQVTFATAGIRTVTAVDSTNQSPIGTATTNVAAPAAVTHFAVYMTPGVTTGVPTSVRIVPEDAHNHFVPNYTGTVTLSSSDASATLPASIIFSAGQAAFFKVTFATLGQQSVTATDSIDTSLGGMASTNVAAPAVATHFVVYLRPGASSGEPTRVLVVAEDAQNHFVPNYTGTVNLTSSDASATLPASVTVQNGYARFEVTFATLGQQSVTATDSANASLTGTATTNVADGSSGEGWGFLSRARWR